MISFVGYPLHNGISWTVHSAPGQMSDCEPLRIAFAVGSARRSVQKREALDELKRVIQAESIGWIVPGLRSWSIDLSMFSDLMPKMEAPEKERQALKWIGGIVEVEPDLESRQTFVRYPVSEVTSSLVPQFESAVVFYVDPETVDQMRPQRTPSESGRAEPVEISESLAAFGKAFPNPMEAAFLMMKFGKTKAHDQFVAAIRKAFAIHGITVLRADDREFHHDLFLNIQTLMHGCGMGVAVFERIQDEEFNPNASLEVGYMMALGKPLCLLKDQNLKTLPTDLIGRLYKPFDVQNPEETIPSHIDRWICDKGLSLRSNSPDDDILYAVVRQGKIVGLGMRDRESPPGSEP